MLKNLSRENLESALANWLSFMESGKLIQSFREYSAGKVNEIELILLD